MVSTKEDCNLRHEVEATFRKFKIGLPTTLLKPLSAESLYYTIYSLFFNFNSA